MLLEKYEGCQPSFRSGYLQALEDLKSKILSIALDHALKADEFDHDSFEHAEHIFGAKVLQPVIELIERDLNGKPKIPEKED